MGLHIDDGAGHDRARVGHQHVDRVAVLRQGVGDEAVVAGIAHGRVQEAVDHEGARRLVHLVLDGLAADGHLDDDVDVLGRVDADGNGIDAHGLGLSWLGVHSKHVGLARPTDRVLVSHVRFRAGTVMRRGGRRGD